MTLLSGVALVVFAGAPQVEDAPRSTIVYGKDSIARTTIDCHYLGKDDEKRLEKSDRIGCELVAIELVIPTQAEWAAKSNAELESFEKSWKAEAPSKDAAQFLKELKADICGKDSTVKATAEKERARVAPLRGRVEFESQEPHFAAVARLCSCETKECAHRFMQALMGESGRLAPECSIRTQASFLTMERTSNGWEHVDDRGLCFTVTTSLVPDDALSVPTVRYWDLRTVRTPKAGATQFSSCASSTKIQEEIATPEEIPLFTTKCRLKL